MYTCSQPTFVISSSLASTWVLCDTPNRAGDHPKKDHFNTIYAFLELKIEQLTDDAYFWTEQDREEAELVLRALSKLRTAMQVDKSE